MVTSPEVHRLVYYVLVHSLTMMQKDKVYVRVLPQHRFAMQGILLRDGKPSFVFFVPLTTG